MHDSQNPVSATAPSAAEDYELAMAISASLQSALEENTTPSANLSIQASSSHPQDGIEWPGHGPAPSGNSTVNSEVQPDSAVPTMPPPDLIASAPPILDAILEDSPVHYPSIELSPAHISSQAIENAPAKLDDTKEDRNSSSCVICLDSPIEGACIPCGHMAGCMSCLNEIKAKKWGCPVCRTKIDQVVRLYAV